MQKTKITDTNPRGAGRKKMKPIDRKAIIRIYLEGTVIKRLGGELHARELATEFLRGKAK